MRFLQSARGGNRIGIGIRVGIGDGIGIGDDGLGLGEVIRGAAFVIVTSVAIAHADPPLVALAPAADARASLAIGPHGEVYAPEKGAWVRRQPTLVAGDVVAGARGAIAVTKDGTVFRLARDGWTAIDLGPHAKAIVGAGPRPLAAVGHAVWELQAVPKRLPDAPSDVHEVAASPSGAVIATDAGLLRVDGATWKPIKRAPHHVDALLSDRFALVAGGVLDLSTMKTIAWPSGLRIAHAAAIGERVVAAALRGKTVELVELRGGKLESSKVDDGTPVAIAVDGKGRVAIALADGRIALRDGSKWSVNAVRDEPAAPHPGSPPASSR